jgi:hypothetical protein
VLLYNSVDCGSQCGECIHSKEQFSCIVTSCRRIWITHYNQTVCASMLKHNWIACHAQAVRQKLDTANIVIVTFTVVIYPNGLQHKHRPRFRILVTKIISMKNDKNIKKHTHLERQIQMLKQTSLTHHWSDSLSSERAQSMAWHGNRCIVIWAAFPP